MRIFTKRNLGIAAIIMAIPALALAWWLGSPLFLDTEVDEEFPMSAEARLPEGVSREEAELEMVEAAEAPDSPAEDPMPESGPTAIAGGAFRNADEFHQGSGSATVYQLEDGSNVLRLEDFEVTNGPDLHVYLVPEANPSDPGDVEGYIDLGELKGNIGDQNYEIPDGVDVSAYHSVVIYCEPFHVVFSVATIES